MMKEIYYIILISALIITTVWREATWRATMKNDIKHLYDEIKELNKKVDVLSKRLWNNKKEN